MSQREPRNPFYLLFLIASLSFVITALAYGVVPVLEEKAKAAGQQLPSSAVRDSLREDGAKWFLCELGAMALFAFLSMGLDRMRILKKDRSVSNHPRPLREALPNLPATAEETNGSVTGKVAGPCQNTDE
jgi:hypothetical protein